VWYWHKNRYEDQWDRIEDLEMNPHTTPTLFLTKPPKTYNGGKMVLQQMVLGKVAACLQKTDTSSKPVILY
jgi:hypothetical protein